MDMNEKSLAASLGLNYLYENEIATHRQNAHLTGGSTQSAFEILARGIEDDTGGSDCSNEEQRLNSETKSLVSWAKREGYQINHTSWQHLVGKHPQLDGATEHRVYRVESASIVVKATIPPLFGLQGSVRNYAQNALVSNILFADNIRFLGVLVDQGSVSIVSAQPYYAGSSPRDSEVTEWFISQGYENVGFHRWKHPLTKVEIADAHIGNFIRNIDGDIFPIDLQVLSTGDVVL
jgi:hypothetical protein